MGFEFLLEGFDCGLEVLALLDELLLVVDVLHLAVVVIFLHVLAVDLDHLHLELLEVLNLMISYLKGPLHHLRYMYLKRLDILHIRRVHQRLRRQLLLHPLPLRCQVLHNQPHIIVRPLKMDNLRIHIRYLLFHLRNLLLSWSNVPLQLLDLVVQHELELLQLLRLLLELLDTSHLVPDGLLPLLDLFGVGHLLLLEFLVDSFLSLEVVASVGQLVVFLGHFFDLPFEGGFLGPGLGLCFHVLFLKFPVALLLVLDFHLHLPLRVVLGAVLLDLVLPLHLLEFVHQPLLLRFLSFLLIS